MEETQMLYAEIFSEAHKIFLSPYSEETPRFEQLLGQLFQSSQILDFAGEHVQQRSYNIRDVPRQRVGTLWPNLLRGNRLVKPENGK